MGDFNISSTDNFENKTSQISKVHLSKMIGMHAGLQENSYHRHGQSALRSSKLQRCEIILEASLQKSFKINSKISRRLNLNL